MNKILLASAAVLGAFCCAQTSQASLVTLPGGDFDVVYDPAQLGLFGTPQLIGDYLVFTPNEFLAQSLNGGGTVVTSSIAAGIQLIAHPGYEFGNLSVSAIGDYLLQGTSASVGVSGSLTASDAARPLTLTTSALVVGSPLNVNDGVVQNWQGTASITNATPTVTPGYNPWLGRAGAIDVQLADTLTATTAPGSASSQAFIQEKFGSVELIVDPMAVPLPGALGLCLSGLVGLACLRRSPRLSSGTPDTSRSSAGPG